MGIDRNIFDRLKERMAAKFPVLLEGYLRDAVSYLETIENNIPGGDLNEVIEPAHSLKSASGLLGLMDVHAHAEKLEYAGKNLQEEGGADLTSLQPLYAALRDAFEAIEGDLKAEL